MVSVDLDRVSAGSLFAANRLEHAAFKQAGPKSMSKTAFKPWLPFQGLTLPVEPLAQDNVTSGDQRSATERALARLEESYARLVDSINLSRFRPERINQYIARAEKQGGIPMSEEEKVRIRKLAETGDEKTLRLLALELRIGVPEKAEREALAALGELFLHRQDRITLEKFLADHHKDENLKAHVRTLLLVNRVENTMHFCQSVKSDLASLLKPSSWRQMIAGVR